MHRAPTFIIMRISGGIKKGLRLSVPPGRGTRPATEKAREFIFSVLGAKVVGTKVLDLFAGSGALGLEALSRGAAQALFVDGAWGAVNTIRRNLDKAGFSSQANVLRRNVFRFLRQAGRQGLVFDLILADPPFALKGLQDLVRMIGEVNILTPKGILVLEHSLKQPVEGTDELKMIRERRFGEIVISMFVHP